MHKCRQQIDYLIQYLGMVRSVSHESLPRLITNKYENIKYSDT